jgi:hypothetical protein
MTRHELMCRMSGWEQTAWQALFALKAEEEQAARDQAESPDGEVIHHGRDIPGLDDDDDEDDDGV